MSYNIKDKVTYLATGEEYMIVATKEVPWSKSNDVYMRKEVYPINDYLIVKYIDTVNGNEKHIGEIDVFAIEIAPLHFT